MHEAHWSVFAAWENFYVIIGSSAAALTGLMFVVITLVSGDNRSKLPDQPNIGFAAFSTPTVVHFGAAFLIAGIVSAPWRSLHTPEILFALIGLLGAAYVARVMRKTRFLTSYQPDFGDWIWFGILPCLAYVAIASTAILLFTGLPQALFALGGATMLLIFIGIHNSWDVVTYLALELEEKPPTP